MSQNLVNSALSGRTDSELVNVLANALIAEGLDLSAIEVACDAVDPERSQHHISWSQNRDQGPERVLVGRVFENMLENEISVLRLGAESERFGAIFKYGATDAIAFASHLAPNATLGFFDDVMSLFATKRPGGFHTGEIALLHLVTPVFALALGARLNATAARVLLQTYLGHNAAVALLSGRVNLGEVEQIRAIVLYCDLVGFTALTEKLDPHLLIEQLNLFFEMVTRPVAQAGGQVSGHIGDAIVMFFPIFDAESEGTHCAVAIKAALAGLKALDLWNASEARREKPPLHARIGIDVGDVVHGNIGSPGRFSFTIIGTPVNRASRLQALAKELGASLMLPSDLAKAAGVSCIAYGQHALNGFNTPIDVVGFESVGGQT